MTAIGHSTVATSFDPITICFGENAAGRRHQPQFTPTPSAWRLQSGLKPSKIRSMSHHVGPLLFAPCIAKPGVPTPRSIAAAKSP